MLIVIVVVSFSLLIAIVVAIVFPDTGVDVNESSDNEMSMTVSWCLCDECDDSLYHGSSLL